MALEDLCQRQKKLASALCLCYQITQQRQLSGAQSR